MKNLIYCIFLLISVSCTGGIKPNHVADRKKRLFEQYLSLFEKRDLPFKVDRKAVLSIINNADVFFEIKDSLKIFIPKELIEKHPDSKFRSLYVLPENNEIVLVMIFEYHIEGYDNEVVETYLVSYNKSGVVLDYQELAGAKIDIWEAFLEINSNYTVRRKLYQLRINTDKDKMRYARLVETCFEYTINNNGLIKETQRTAQEGYSEGDKSGYYLIEPIKGD